MGTWGIAGSGNGPKFVAIALATIASLAPRSNALADAFGNYTHTRDVTLPGGTSAFDVQPDGRLAALSGLNLHTETAAGSGLFVLHGTLPTANVSYGAAFLRFSPDGSKLAVGNNGSGGTSYVGVFSLNTLAGAWHALDHFDAEWLDDERLAVNSGDLSTSRIDLFDTTTLAGATIVSGIEGGSGGVTFDAQGRLFVGNGYANGGGSDTGEIRAFEQSAWESALVGSPLDFESNGTVIADVLSANTLGFDIEGNLHIGGGDFSQPDYGYAGLLAASAVDGAIGGDGPIDTSMPANARRFDPDAAGSFNFYGIAASPVAAELYVRDYGVDALHVFEVPEPSAVMLLAIGLGVIAMRRSRRRRSSGDFRCATGEVN